MSYLRGNPFAKVKLQSSGMTSDTLQQLHCNDISTMADKVRPQFHQPLSMVDVWRGHAPSVFLHSLQHVLFYQ